MTIKVIPERLEALRSALVEAAERVKQEQQAWSELTRSKADLEKSVRLNGATPSEAQEEFWKYMDDHEERYSKALQDLEKKRKEFSEAYRLYRNENT